MFRLPSPRRVVFVFAVFLFTRYLIHTRTSPRKLLSGYLISSRFQEKSAKNVVAIARESLVVEEGLKRDDEAFPTEKPFSACFEDEEKWDDYTKPRYTMDPDKFLIPTLMNGPNNQMMGLRESIIVALLLNRTLVLPAFYDHEVQGAIFRKPVPAEHRIDLAKLRSFISVVPNHKAIEACNSRIDVVFATKGKSHVRATWRKIVRIFMETGLSGTQFVDGVGEEEFDLIKKYLYDHQQIVDDRLASMPWWPKNRTDIAWVFKIMKTGEPITVLPEKEIETKLENVKVDYKTSAKCALHWFPFSQFTFEKTNRDAGKKQEKVNLHEFDVKDGWKLHSDILWSTPPPRAVCAWADEFRRENLGSVTQDYLAVHWRFDDEDFFGYICKESAGRKKFCDEVKRASNATAIATAIATRIDEIQSLYSRTIETVYFAAPPTLNFLVESVEKEFKKSGASSRKVRSADSRSKTDSPSFFSLKHLKKFILQRYSGCNMASSQQLSDTISQIEMSLCQHSFSFMWSRQSTWSKNVRLQRFLHIGALHRKLDVSIKDYALRMVDRRR